MSFSARVTQVSSPGRPRSAEARRLVSWTGETACFPRPPGPPRGDHCALTGGHEIVARAVGLDRDFGPERHSDLERLTVATVAQSPLPMAPRGAP